MAAGMKMKDSAPDDVYEGKDSNVAKEAKSKGSFKKGGATKNLGMVSGSKAGMRLDKPGRKSGGAVGSNKNPFSTAHNYTESPTKQSHD